MSTQKYFIQEPEAYDLLEKCTHGVLSTVSAQGIPYGVPINYYLSRNENCIYFHCAKEGHKLKNISENNNVSFVAVVFEKIVPEKINTYYESVVLTGKAFIVEDEAERTDKILAFMQKFAPAHPCAKKENVQDCLKNTAICKIQILRITGKRKLIK